MENTFIENVPTENLSIENLPKTFKITGEATFEKETLELSF